MIQVSYLMAKSQAVRMCSRSSGPYKFADIWVRRSTEQSKGEQRLKRRNGSNDILEGFQLSATQIGIDPSEIN